MSPRDAATEPSEALRLAAEAAHSSQSAFQVDVADFARHLESKVEEAGGLRLDRVHVDDVYLAFAVGSGVSAAVEQFESIYGQDIDRVVRKTVDEAEAAADLGQLIRTKLLVGPRLLSYGGRGALQGWVRVIASRMVIDAHRRAQARPESSLEPQVIDALDDLRLDPSTELLRHKYRDDVKQAMEVAFAALSIKERRLLRGALVQRLKTDDLGALFGVHRTTVARWLEDARSSLVERTRAELSRRLDARDDTVRSLIGLVRSTIDLSVTRLLQSRDGDVVP